jgi:hypothetical protein
MWIDVSAPLTLKSEFGECVNDVMNVKSCVTLDFCYSLIFVIEEL